MTRELESIRGELQEFPSERATQLQAKNANYFWAYVRNGLEAARIFYLMDLPLKDVHAVIRTTLPELATYLDMGGVVDAGVFRDVLGAALLAADAKLLKWILELPPDQYTDPGMQYSEAAYRLVEALQAGGRGDAKGLASSVKKLRASLNPRKLIVDPRAEKSIFEPPAQLLEAVAAGDQAAFDKAWSSAGAAYKKRYGRPSDRGDWDGILDFVALGIARIAENSALKVPASNPYAPPELLQAPK